MGFKSRCQRECDKCLPFFPLNLCGPKSSNGHQSWDTHTYTHTLPLTLHETRSQHTGNRECSLITGHMLRIKTLEVQLHIIQLCWLCGSRHTHAQQKKKNPLQRITTYRWEILSERKTLLLPHTHTDTSTSDET